MFEQRVLKLRMQRELLELDVLDLRYDATSVRCCRMECSIIYEGVACTYHRAGQNIHTTDKGQQKQLQWFILPFRQSILRFSLLNFNSLQIFIFIRTFDYATQHYPSALRSNKTRTRAASQLSPSSNCCRCINLAVTIFSGHAINEVKQSNLNSSGTTLEQKQTVVQ